MNVTMIETTGLGDRSYLVTDGDTAAVIDPQRDIDRVLELAREKGVVITHVLETHIHNDYVTGGLELARTVGAEYVVAADDDVRYERRGVVDGDVVDAGPFRFQVMHTPGHTHHHAATYYRTRTAEPSVCSAVARCCTAPLDAPIWWVLRIPRS
jgi:hydroxyacylglutathione hydrolase